MIFCRNFRAMGRDCEVRLVCDNKSHADRGLTLAREELERIAVKYSSTGKQSYWQQLVFDAGAGSGVSVDEETACLLDTAELGHTISEGMFDITLSAMLEIWDWKAARLPGTTAIAEAMARSGWSRVDWQRPVLGLPDLGMKIDLGGLIREYAVDTCVKLLQARGFHSVLVVMGGDMAACLEEGSDPPWQVMIQQSSAPRSMATRVELGNGGLSTRGDYDRCMVVNGIRYSNLLDPRNGWPVQGLASVSVIAAQCVTAGVLATTAMVRGPDRGPAWLETLGVQYLCTNSTGGQFGPLFQSTEDASGVA